MKFLIAPDKFKHALAAEAVASALAEGVRAAAPAAEVVCCPLADGGDGTGPLLATALGATACAASVSDALGRPRAARWWRTPAGLGIVELAEAAGVAQLADTELRPLQATTRGVGALLRAAYAGGGREIVLGIGGSATIDGGAGCLQALGFRLLDRDGRAIAEPVGGGDLERIAALEPPAEPWAVPLTVLCDVDNLLLGPRGAAPVFGPQKGASPADVAVLERGLAHWADVLARCCGRDPRGVVHGGAAGGIAAGLWAALGARLAPGFDAVSAYVGLPEKLHDVALCLTGEGRVDAQTAAGKVVAGVARLAAAAGVPVIVLAGQVAWPAADLAAAARALGVEQVVELTPRGTPLDEALAATRANLSRSAAAAVAAFCARPGRS